MNSLKLYQNFKSVLNILKNISDVKKIGHQKTSSYVRDDIIQKPRQENLRNITSGASILFKHFLINNIYLKEKLPYIFHW